MAEVFEENTIDRKRFQIRKGFHELLGIHNHDVPHAHAHDECAI